MVPLLDDTPVIEDDDPARVAYGAHAVRRDDRGPIAERLTEPAEDVGLGVRVHGREGVVEDQDVTW